MTNLVTLKRTPKLRAVESDEPRLRYPIRHRASLPGHEWPIRFEWERP